MKKILIISVFAAAVLIAIVFWVKKEKAEEPKYILQSEIWKTLEERVHIEMERRERENSK
jgi:hypothetical protein